MKHIWFAATLLLVSQGAWSADLSKAEQLLNAGQAEAALSEAESFLNSDPNNADGRFIQGIALARLGRNNDAIAIFKDLTSDYPGIPEPFNNLAVLLAQSGDYAGARNALEDAVKTHPNYTVGWENLADIYSVMATEAYEKVLEQNPGNAAAKQRLAAMSGAVSQAAAPARPAPEAENKTSSASAAVSPAVPEVAAATKQKTPAAAAIVETTSTAPATPVIPAKAQPEGAVIMGSGDMSSEQLAVMQPLTEWANAWADRDVEGYLAAYSHNYEPQDDQDRTAWEKARRSRLSKPEPISLQLNNVDIKLLGADYASVKFEQKYRSASYSDTVRKTLLMERENGHWRIVREQSIR